MIYCLFNTAEMNLMKKVGQWVLLLSIVLVTRSESASHQDHQPYSYPLEFAQLQPDAGGAGRVRLIETDLIDQDGRKVKFKSEVIGDRIAAIVPFYTTCTTAYPILIFTFSRLQDLLGERLGKEVVLISISVDPKTDIPVRMKAFAGRQKARPGWIFLTGERNNLAQILQGIGVQYIVGRSLDEHQHIPLTLVGNASGEWRRFHGYPSPEQVLAQINKSLAVKQESEGKSKP